MKREHTASLIVKLEGDSSVDANTLINVLTHYVTITERANQIIGDGAYRTRVRVKAINKGSFEIACEVVSSWLQNLITMENIGFASTLACGVGSVFSLYKHFKGEKINDTDADKVSKYTMKNRADVIVQVYNDPVVNEALRKSFETAMADTSVRGVTIIADGNKTETISEDEFPELVIPKEDIHPHEQSVTDPSAQLSIISLSFNKGENWKFIYQGNKITTKLSDDGLQKAIDSGASFAKGDALRVELTIVQKWNEEYRAYVNDRYKVENVLEHIQSPKQHRLFADHGEECK